jgi:intracellular septation protein
MKLLFDFLPIVVFFAAFSIAEGDAARTVDLANAAFGGLAQGGSFDAREASVLLASLVVMLATAAQLSWLKRRRRQVETTLWVSLVLVLLLVGLTIWLRNDTFVRWKPSVLYWALGVAFWLSPMLFGRNLPKALLGEHFDAPAWVWLRLNLLWIGFFSAMGLLNLWVAYTFDTETWVNYKLFGGIGLLFAFTLAQALYLARHARSSPADRSPAAKAGGSR